MLLIFHYDMSWCDVLLALFINFDFSGEGVSSGLQIRVNCMLNIYTIRLYIFHCGKEGRRVKTHVNNIRCRLNHWTFYNLFILQFIIFYLLLLLEFWFYRYYYFLGRLNKNWFWIMKIITPLLSTAVVSNWWFSEPPVNQVLMLGELKIVSIYEKGIPGFS